AADVAARILLPEVRALDAVARGGDRRALDEVLADPRLAPVAVLVTGPLLAVPDPRLKVLQATPEQFLAVRITLTP
ncbi:MAG: Vms1/Ankzf1 family peptidyl-tRNA hydrolase, partial [Actinocrinis sp.]